MVATISILSSLDNGEFSFIGLSFNSHDMVVDLSGDIEGTSFPITTTQELE